MTLVVLQGVAKQVRLVDDSTLDILRGVDLEIDAGDHVSIVGRSGSGKTTLLNILGMLDAPTAGSVMFDGREVARLSSRRRDIARGRDIGFVFQQFNLLSGRTALENVIVPLLYSSGRTFWRRREIATSMLERVGLGDRLDAKPDRLSGGEQQRVAIARALVRRPRLILADEPTGALDIETGASVMALLDDVATESGAALVAITHDLHVAARARRHFRLDEGVLQPADLEHAFAASTLAGTRGGGEAAPESAPQSVAKPAPKRKPKPKAKVEPAVEPAVEAEPEPEAV